MTYLIRENKSFLMEQWVKLTNEPLYEVELEQMRVFWRHLVEQETQTTNGGLLVPG